MVTPTEQKSLREQHYWIKEQLKMFSYTGRKLYLQDARERYEIYKRCGGKRKYRLLTELGE